MIATIPIKDEASKERVERMKNAMRADQVAQMLSLSVLLIVN